MIIWFKRNWDVKNLSFEPSVVLLSLEYQLAHLALKSPIEIVKKGLKKDTVSRLDSKLSKNLLNSSWFWLGDLYRFLSLHSPMPLPLLIPLPFFCTCLCPFRCPSSVLAFALAVSIAFFLSLVFPPHLPLLLSIPLLLPLPFFRAYLCTFLCLALTLALARALALALVIVLVIPLLLSLKSPLLLPLPFFVLIFFLFLVLPLPLLLLLPLYLSFLCLSPCSWSWPFLAPALPTILPLPLTLPFRCLCRCLFHCPFPCPCPYFSPCYFPYICPCHCRFPYLCPWTYHYHLPLPRHRPIIRFLLLLFLSLHYLFWPSLLSFFKLLEFTVVCNRLSNYFLRDRGVYFQEDKIGMRSHPSPSPPPSLPSYATEHSRMLGFSRNVALTH